MTRSRMLAHLAAVVWHGREAILESDAASVPIVVLDLVEIDPSKFGIDEGYVTEQSHRDSHILPPPAPTAPSKARSRSDDDETGEPQ